jgi:hypothetical protein
MVIYDNASMNFFSLCCEEVLRDISEILTYACLYLSINLGLATEPISEAESESHSVGLS